MSWRSRNEKRADPTPRTSTSASEVAAVSAPKDHLLVFVPGIMGTELNYKGPGEFRGFVNEPVWSENLSVLWTTLRSNQNRLAMATDLQPGRVLRRIRACPLMDVEDVYGPLLTFLEERLGYVEGLTFLAFGYDWRKSNQATADELARRLREFIANGVDRIKILAHSMGGLVVRLLLLDKRNEDIAPHVAAFIQIGSPIKGSPQALPTLKKRPQFGGVCSLILRAADHVSPESYHELMQALGTFPSLYELLPHEPDAVVLTTAGDQLTAHDKKLWPYTDLELFGDLRALQSKVRSWSGPTLNCIYSTDINTDAIYYTDNRLSELKPMWKVAGDGTVIVASAADGAGTSQCHPISEGIEHGYLPNAPTVQDLIKTLLI